jgi:hypothetical protein
MKVGRPPKESHHHGREGYENYENKSRNVRNENLNSSNKNRNGEIIAENFLTLCNDIDTCVQEAFQTPNRHDQRTNTCHIIIKMSKLQNKGRVLKAV